MYIRMPKKKTKVSNVNTNVNNIHVNIHSKKRKVKQAKQNLQSNLFQILLMLA